MSAERPELIFRRPLPPRVRELRHDHGATVFDFVAGCPRCEAERELELRPRPARDSDRPAA